MGTKWALLFGVVMLACAGLFVIAPFSGWWLPERASSHAWDIDFLFYVILGVTSFFFLLTEAILVYFMARFGAGEKAAAPEVPARLQSYVQPLMKLLDSQHKVELAWTLVPAAILLYIAFAQVGTWANVKYQSRQERILGEKVPVQADVSARQFEWRIRYPSSARMTEWLEKKGDAAVVRDAESFKKFPQKDDVHVVNELHCWKDNPVLVHLSTRDVIHSFNLPHMRVKQDALPGKQIPVWFRPIRANVDGEGVETQVWELACAELCGWGHGRMIGRLYVHETREDFLKWLRQQEGRQYSLPTTTAAAK